ncbi:MAG: tRNA dihydrouridine synthase DusB [Clostridia bacterium]|nr:tRNA dihydrouridine synthase DusB [Clostridia bacterium]
MTDKLLIALSPMAGISDWPMRTLCTEMGCNYTTTEMISAQGFLSAPDTMNIYRFLLAVGPEEPAPAAQIFGRHEELLSRAAARLTESGRFSGIDINMGCPAQKVVTGGAGSALMKDLPLCSRIIRSVRKSTSLPLSVKMRLGWDPEHITAPELAHIAEDCGADLITIHGRTRIQQYSGHADWEAIAMVKRTVSIPVICNGDIDSAESALLALRKTGCDGIAVGRGALGNPFIFRQIRSALQGQRITFPNDREIIETAVRHGEMMRSWKGEHAAMLEMRKHMAWYIRGKKGAAKLRARIVTAGTLDEMYSLMQEFTRIGPDGTTAPADTTEEKGPGLF